MTHASAIAWMEWADDVFTQPASRVSPESAVLIDVAECVERWTASPDVPDEQFRLRSDADADELEYFIHAFFSLDMQVADEEQALVHSDIPDEARAFYVALVGAVLHALETESQSRAAFVEQLRSSWPCAAEGM